ncbi:MAG: HD domain-containing protein [Acidobacteria bacterium]|nr:HD domain-containing protein [Acidobacteriota bacterium]
MPIRARVYIATIVLAGSAALARELAQWTCPRPALFGTFLLIAVLSSLFKVSLPGIKGTMSMSYIFLMLSVANLGLSETLIIGLATTLAQSFWKYRERPKAVHVLFNSASIIIALMGAYGAFHSAIVTRILALPVAQVFLSAAVYFFLNTWSIALVIALTGQGQVLAIWKSSYLWSFPHYLLSASIVAVVEALGPKLGAQVFIIVLPVAYVVFRSYRLHVMRLEEEKARAEEARRHAQEMSALHLRTIHSLALAIEAKDETTHDHLQRVQVYALEIGRELLLTEVEMQALQAAAILHDIGKIAVPESIISKPGKLTPEEFAKMKIHPVVGAEIVENVGFPYAVAPLVRGHHEKWDGSGYPDGLKAEEIPMGARILSAVDCLDALASDRQYRRALPLEKAMAVVVADSGKSFDPRVVEVLQRRFLELEQKAREAPTVQPPVLSIDLRVERGAAPATGYAGGNVEGATTGSDDGSALIVQLAAAHKQLQGLDELSAEFGRTVTPDELLGALEQRLRAWAPFDCFAVYVRHGDHLRPAFVRGEHADLFAHLEIPVGHGLSGWVAENRKPMLNGNPSVEPGRLSEDPRFAALRSGLAIPFESTDEVLGVLALYHRDRDAYTANHLRLLMGIRSRLAPALETAISHQAFRRSARTDELTNLPNPAALVLMLDSEIARCRRSNSGLAVVAVEPDGPWSQSQRLSISAALRESGQRWDIVARTAGEGFDVVLSVHGAAALNRRVQKLKETVERALTEISPDGRLSVRFGEASFPADAANSVQLLALAHERVGTPRQATAGLPVLLDAVRKERGIDASAPDKH